MKSFVRSLLFLTIALLAGFIVGSVAILATPIYTNIPAVETIQDPDNISSNIPNLHQRVISISRNSAVRVYSMAPSLLNVSSSSGTYLKLDGKYYVLTTAHGILGDCNAVLISVGDKRYECKRYAEINRLVDYAIIEVEKIPTVEAVEIPTFLPRGSRWAAVYSIMNKTYYTGYPNNSGPVTLSGEVIGYTSADFLLLDSFAWSGSSGSGVFSEDGKFIGYVLAIDIGETPYGIDVLEDMVIVVPSFKINWAYVANTSK